MKAPRVATITSPGALLSVTITAALTLAACAPGDPAAVSAELVRYTEKREICDERSATRNAYFGDLHIHTAFSYDARPAGTETTPADAYRFARGESIPVPPYDEQGNPTAMQQLKRPLDFAAVTDHSEFFGEMRLCYDPGSEVFEMPSCQSFREGGPEATLPFGRIVSMTDPERLADICGEDGARCVDASASLWELTQEMAEAAYDRSADCSFTSFVGYEHTGTPNANNLHRNVIFRNDKVPARAISFIDTPTERDLWAQLTEQCLDGVEGCDVLAIPHNSNLSSGAMFPSYIGGFESAESARAMAALRNTMEPVMEVFQHKGNSECFNGLPDILGAPDELCDIEQVRRVGREVDVFGQTGVVKFCEAGEIGRRGFLRTGCISRNDFFRSVLLTGLQDEAAIGINSYKLGVIASTDTHMSLAGDTDEDHWLGHLVREVNLVDRLTKVDYFAQSLDANPGGLAGVWAVENSRDAIFEALRRREVFGTTGTRIEPRLFGGWTFAADACEREERESHGYAMGTPMGGDFAGRPAGASPRLFAAAAQDPGGVPLQKLQIIKGWIDGDGQAHYRVFDLAGQHDHAGEIDLETGAWSGAGASALCAVFEDPAFDATQPAYYYLRVVEVPTLRWSWRACLALTAGDRPAECDNDAPKTIQELAWTSPIWYLPDDRAVRTPDG
ncbi:MAG: DUF3604 domain-containing protein [Gammaproteobacteria bacterium]|nr:DUF3604 domain-containing protein [Gammaproteobacteria bacterium]